MTEPRTTARRVLDEEAAAAAGQTPGETAALKRYGATGGVRSAEWIQKNLGAAGLTPRELASRYYVPGVKDTEVGGEVSRGRTGVTLAQVMALPKGDLDRAAAMGALTAAELDTRRYARMVTEAPKEVARGGDVVNTVARLSVRADLTPDDESLMAGYVSGIAGQAVPARPKAPRGAGPAAAPPAGASAVRPVPREDWGSYRKMDFGLRADGKTKKGMGFFGPIDVGGGNIATELSVRMKGPDGKLVHIPSLVPTLTGGELKGLLTDFDRAYTPEVERKVKAFAASRISRGLSPFAGPDEIVPFPDFDKAAKAETLARRTTLLF